MSGSLIGVDMLSGTLTYVCVCVCVCDQSGVGGVEERGDDSRLCSVQFENHCR